MPKETKSPQDSQSTPQDKKDPARPPVADRAPTPREQSQADKEDHVDRREKLSESLD